MSIRGTFFESKNLFFPCKIILALAATMSGKFNVLLISYMSKKLEIFAGSTGSIGTKLYCSSRLPLQQCKAWSRRKAAPNSHTTLSLNENETTDLRKPWQERESTDYVELREKRLIRGQNEPIKSLRTFSEQLSRNTNKMETALNYSFVAVM